MTSQLQPREVELFRCLKKTAFQLMLLYRLDKPVGEIDIASILDMQPQTVRTYLKSLAHLGLVTRTHRYQGWTLTGGVRQMIPRESTGQICGEHARKIKTSAKISRSLLARRRKVNKRQDRTVRGSSCSNPLIRANLEALSSIGLARNHFVSEICQMDHVSPEYILGQKRRLEAERRYSHGLLLTVIRSSDYLPEKYLARETPEPQIAENDQEIEEEPEAIQEIEPDPSIYAPLSKSGMTAARAWSTVLRQLHLDMPKAAYDKWVRDTVVLSANNGIFVIGMHDCHSRDWLESRLSSTVTRHMCLVRMSTPKSIEVMCSPYSNSLHLLTEVVQYDKIYLTVSKIQRSQPIWAKGTRSSP